MTYAHLHSRDIERLSRSVAPGAWAIEAVQPLSTLLGSCVAVCMYDKGAGIGGLNHFMLPNLQRTPHSEVDALLAGDYCMEALLNGLLAKGARKPLLEAKAFGGGTIIESLAQGMNIGRRNADFARDWLAREGIPLVASDFLGPWSRKILFLPENGDAYCRRMVTSMATSSLIKRETAYADALARQITQRGASTEKKIELF
ncbi:chemotaxis protein CheD [Azovibrio restrictus]|uniref:chemotaxis protein CheD n=1 Tax=Azovibrio restrictus TaxID=146938 RepID=UPI00040594A8|nr:chemotaxis protein CheD [Azovibrio restrictus]